VRRFAQVSGTSDSLWDTGKRLESDWGSSDRSFKSCQPDHSPTEGICSELLRCLAGWIRRPGALGHLGPQVLRQRLTGTRNRLAIRVQVALRRAQFSVAGDLPEHVHRHGLAALKCSPRHEAPPGGARSMFTLEHHVVTLTPDAEAGE
jgi:hypothetical protein